MNVKSMRKMLLLTILFCIPASVFPESFELPGNGCTVIFPANPSKQERYAAELLAEYLGKMLHAETAAVPEKKGIHGRLILVGETEAAKTAGFTQKIPPQGYRLDEADGNLFIRGGRPGPLNGVLSFLEEDLGFRYYASPVNSKNGKDPGLVHIPDLRGKKISVNPHTCVPKFTIREIMFMYGTKADPEGVLFSRMNPVSYHSFLPDSSGGKLNSSRYFIHTYAGLLPPAEYYAEHPEYYALQNGRRTRPTSIFGSVCFTNPKVPEIMAEHIRNEIAKTPEARYCGVSACDTSKPQCECPGCAPLIRKYGIPGIQLMLANSVAEKLAPRYPDIMLTTLVYSDLNISNIKAHPNVALFLAPINARFNAVSMLVPLQENQVIRKAVENCGKISDSVIFWDYLDGAIMPYPTFDQFRESIQYLAALKSVKGYFADCTNGGVSLSPLKKWVFAHLLWNPEADMEPLISEFIRAYYGPAAGEMAEYTALIRGTWKRFIADRRKAGEAGGVFLQYTPEEKAAMRRLFANAMKKAGTDEILRGRIAREQLVFLAMELSGNPAAVGVEQYGKDLAAAKALLGYSPWNSLILQRKLPERWQKKFDRQSMPPDPLLYSPGTVSVRMPLVVAGLSEWADDPAALKGKAARHLGATPWGIQWNYAGFKDFLMPGKTYVIRLRVRPEVKRVRTSGQMFIFKSFHHGNEKLNSAQPTLFGNFSDADRKGAYRWIPIGKLKFENPDAAGMFWMDSCVDRNESVWYDGMELIPLDEYKNPSEVPDRTLKL